MATIDKRLNSLEQAVNPPGDDESIVFVVIYDTDTGEPLNGEPPEAARVVMWLPDNGRDSMYGATGRSKRTKKAKR